MEEEKNNLGLGKKLMYGLAGFVLGVLANSYDVRTTEQFRFNNPVPINATLDEQLKIVEKRPYMIDEKHSLHLFGLEVPLATYRTITDPLTGKIISGRLDELGNISRPEKTYELKSMHDSNFYLSQNVRLEGNNRLKGEVELYNDDGKLVGLIVEGKQPSKTEKLERLKFLEEQLRKGNINVYDEFGFRGKISKKRMEDVRRLMKS